MLLIFSGLPGSGKSTIDKKLAKKIRATYLRVDTIEQILRSQSHNSKIGPEDYFVLYALARENLQLGSMVITDSVNDLHLIRDTFRDMALSLTLPFLEIEIICSDQKQHQKRVENRILDILGLIPPNWDSVIHRHYEPWERELLLDTAHLSADACVDKILKAMLVD